MSSAPHNVIFLLSPASCSGKRAQMLLSDEAKFDLALRVRLSSGAPLGETFSFLSGLYFRGKLAYAARFARNWPGIPSSLVITAGQGLAPPDSIVTVNRLRAFAEVPIDVGEPRYYEPLTKDGLELAAKLSPQCRVVLLGSVATPKYHGVLARAFGGRLYFPTDFVGRGDMSRGGLMLRCVDTGVELSYSPLAGAALRGTRPAKLPPKAAD